MSTQLPAIGLSLLGHGFSAADMSRIGRMADQSGLDSLWTGDYVRDAFVQAALLGRSTERIRIGTAVAQGFVRTPLTTALAALDLDELCDGRFILGIGSQVRGVIEGWHGLEFSKPAARLADCTRAIRAAMRVGADRPARYGGPFYSFDLSGHSRGPAPRKVPIYMAAGGPRMTTAAMEAADGLVGHILWSDRQLRAVAEARDRLRSDPFELCTTVVCSVSDDGVTAEEEARRTLGFYAATKTYRPLLVTDGFETEAHHAHKALRNGDPDAIRDAVSDRMLATYGLAGTPEEVRAQLAARSIAIDTAILVPAWYQTSKERLLRQIELIIEAFASRG